MSQTERDRNTTPGGGKRIAIFGGSFNPPHVAHQLVALYVLETQPVDELWFVPTFSHPFGKQLASYEDRVAMCELAAAPLGPRLIVSRAEQVLASRPGFVASRTLDLIEDLEVTRPGDTFRLVVGADILNETSQWYRWPDLVAKAPLIVIGRSGVSMPEGSVVTGLVMPEVSATAARVLLAALTDDQRAQLALGLGSRHAEIAPTTEHRVQIQALLPAQVLIYIATRNLFR